MEAYPYIQRICPESPTQSVEQKIINSNSLVMLGYKCGSMDRERLQRVLSTSTVEKFNMYTYPLDTTASPPYSLAQPKYSTPSSLWQRTTQTAAKYPEYPKPRRFQGQSQLLQALLSRENKLWEGQKEFEEGSVNTFEKNFWEEFKRVKSCESVYLSVDAFLAVSDKSLEHPSIPEQVLPPLQPLAQLYRRGIELSGINTPEVLVGMAGTVLPWTLQPFGLGAVQSVRCGTPVIVYSIRRDRSADFQAMLKEKFPHLAKECPSFPSSHSPLAILPADLGLDPQVFKVKRTIVKPGQTWLTPTSSYQMVLFSGFSIIEKTCFWGEYYESEVAAKWQNACACEKKTNEHEELANLRGLQLLGVDFPVEEERLEKKSALLHGVKEEASLGEDGA